ncbi:manganese ABC transporter ATP-binding protein [Lysinibacillus sp. 2017]|uniref:metal ABC transporter ATP-binding protein n=1 Tax=unclassified Lysinibacillus TaxID=2636778 RepID=UPI000D527C16|nr:MULTISPECIES: metal ABC transporter ATP-binding protein [unclassified Lysinibacillus]AWE07838.1 manganese ABC transporter ATP-binding protein [Lysinibacillus sp. 2017]TGN32269.1 metal ABC transporter ATP-binding protein [Lysinibacillus sp. S2017]
MEALKVENLAVAYDKKKVLQNVNISVPTGHLTAIIGPNGAGKSTLLKAILNQLPNKVGRVEILGKVFSPKSLIVGYVPQRNAVDWDFPTTAIDIVLMGRYGHRGLFKRITNEDKKQALAALTSVGMQDFAERSIGQLSGGQQQRVFLARALAQNAEVYFLDEPFAGVDAATEKTIIDILKRLKAEGKSIFVVHHDLQTVKDYFDYTILLNKTIITSGATEDVFTVDQLQKTYGGKLLLMNTL